MNEKQEKVYNVAFDLIEIRLNKKESILPFTVTLEKGKVDPVIGMYESLGGNTAEDIENIRKELKGRIDDLEVLCLCYDVRVVDPRTGEKTDAIQIELAGREMEGVNIYIPYNLDGKERIRKPFQVVSNEKYF